MEVKAKERVSESAGVRCARTVELSWRKKFIFEDSYVPPAQDERFWGTGHGIDHAH